MRTTIDLNDDLFRRAKKKATDENITLREVIERALREHLGGRRGPGKTYRFNPRLFRGKGLQPGLSEADLADRDRLFDVLEERR